MYFFSPGYSRIIFENKFEMPIHKYVIPIQNKKIRKFVDKYFINEDGIFEIFLIFY